MKNKRSVFILIMLGLLLVAIVIPFFTKNDAETEDVELTCTFSFKENLSVSFGQKAAFDVACSENQKKIELFLDDSLIQTYTNKRSTFHVTLDPKNLELGMHSIKLVAVNAQNKSSIDERIVTVLSDIVPEAWKTNILNTYPHNDSSFTQGLVFSGGRMFEGTGDPGQIGASFLGEVDFKSGKIIRKTTLPAPYFGEGIAIVGERIYQLTWQNHTCFVYNEADFKNTQKFDFGGEGWGICYTGQYLVVSDGSERLTFRDPLTFKELKSIQVYTNEGAVMKLNELEYVDGFIYANIWTTNLIAVIDPLTGKVIANIDATNLAAAGRGNGEVLNGIAYNDRNKKLYMTGKFWSKLFEVSLEKPVKAL